MVKQRIDIGDLVECQLDIDGRFGTGVVIARKAINSNYNTDRHFHPDEYHCKVMLFSSQENSEARWIRTKWLKLLSKAQ